MNKYYIYTYGCQMNVHESEKIAGTFEALGFSAAESAEEADLIAFNTCCVRENAEQHVYGNVGALKPLKKKKPSLIIAVGGCMTQQPGEAEKLHRTFPFVDIVFGTHNLSDLGEMVRKRIETRKRVIEIAESGVDGERQPVVRGSYPNAWVNVMYGCNNFCTYCIVPYVRGREISRRPEDILSEVKALVREGYKEITLLGQNVNSYGRATDVGMDFAGLLSRVSEIDGKFRIRFMSNHPKDFNEKLVEVIAKDERICNCIHLPLQSGSNEILRRMNRRYTAEEYLEKVRMLKKAIPGCAVTSDVMIGFPGETEEDFSETLRVVREADFAGAFTFVYSRRPGTVADKMDGQIDDQTKKDRIMRLVELQNSINREQSKAYKDKTIEILCEDYDEKRKLYIGRDEYGKMGYFDANENMVGKFVNIKINECNGISLYGELT
ncbi:MAG: tRNA (N6-isopentenyl adenosine(37)-C2)-methylthiotransferase MiaB [Clostridia bacterium]|nr:tRNA (N6-isopentenyl adenosine(37)-C2)-methylthiotransferase MiaB [Clostridia bacterium]